MAFENLVLSSLLQPVDYPCGLIIIIVVMVIIIITYCIVHCTPNALLQVGFPSFQHYQHL